MRRRDSDKGTEVESPKKVEHFLDEIETVCRKYDMSIGHEDTHGAFVIQPMSDRNIAWLRGAQLAGFFKGRHWRELSPRAFEKRRKAVVARKRGPGITSGSDR